jgi:hypothetical protein
MNPRRFAIAGVAVAVALASGGCRQRNSAQDEPPAPAAAKSESEERIEQAMRQMNGLPYDSPLMKELVDSSLDLRDPEVSRYMSNFLKRRRYLYMSEIPPTWVMERLLRTSPERAFEWLLDHSDEFDANARANMALSMAALHYREAYEVAFALLGDTEVEDLDINRERAPLAVADDLIPRRVCDHAASTLRWMIGRDSDYQASFKGIGYHWSAKLDDRNAAIEHLRQWRKTSGDEFLRGRETLSRDRPGLKKKVDAFVAKQGKKPAPASRKP